jgi:hypothetical protein
VPPGARGHTFTVKTVGGFKDIPLSRRGKRDEVIALTGNSVQYCAQTLRSPSRLSADPASVIRRAPRPCVAKLNDQRMKTTMRF